MIASDTSTWIDFFEGNHGPTEERLVAAIRDGNILMPPPVLTELLSANLTLTEKALTQKVLRMDLKSGYWERAGEIRRSLLQKGLRANTVDCLIAQCCLDSDIPLITNDTDFRHFQVYGLKLA